MYKSRITKWGLEKRNKGLEIMAVVRKKNQRDRMGKASEFRVRGRLIDMDNVQRYLKRKGISLEDGIKLSVATPPEVRCCTPDAIPRSPEVPEIFQAPQQIFSDIRNYIHGSIESKTWFLSNEDGYHISVKGEGQAVSAIGDFLHIFNVACDLLNKRYYKRAGHFLIRSAATIRDVVLQDRPQTLVQLLNMLLRIRRHGWIDVVSSILNQFSNMAATVLPDIHPLRRILNHLSCLVPELPEDILINSWESFLDIFESILGVSSVSATQSRLIFIFRVESARDPGKAEAQLRTMIERCKEVHGNHDYRYGEAMLALADFLSGQRRYTDAAVAAEEVIHCTSEGTCSYASHLWCRAMTTLARTRYEILDDQSAVSTLRQVIDMRIAGWGWQDGMTLRLLTQLEEWLTEFGRPKEAADVSRQIAEILRQSNAFV
jgi:hypothetical protein